MSGADTSSVNLFLWIFFAFLSPVFFKKYNVAMPCGYEDNWQSYLGFEIKKKVIYGPFGSPDRQLEFFHI